MRELEADAVGKLKKENILDFFNTFVFSIFITKFFHFSFTNLQKTVLSLKKPQREGKFLFKSLGATTKLKTLGRGQRNLRRTYWKGRRESRFGILLSGREGWLFLRMTLNFFF